MLAFQSAIGNNLLYIAYSDFKLAPAVSTAGILATVIGGVLKLPIGKTLNLVGRAEGLLFFVCVYVLGIILLASCNGPDAYAAGYVLYWIGYDAIYLILDVFMADTSGLRNRAFAFGFVSTPFICTAFTGSLAAESFVRTSGWRWGYGAFAIIMPFVFIPLAVVFKYYERKAIKLGLFKREDSGRTAMQSVLHYFHEFDSEFMFGWFWETFANILQSSARSFSWQPLFYFCSHSVCKHPAASHTRVQPSSQWLSSEFCYSQYLRSGRHTLREYNSFAGNFSKTALSSGPAFAPRH